MSTISNGNLGITIRDPESYPEKLKYLLDLITFNEIPKVVGSYAYTTHKYPSDVDVFERVTVNLPADEAGLFYESQFKIIFGKLLMNSNKFFIIDFKAGEDKLLKQFYNRTDLSVNNLQIQRDLKSLLSPQTFNNLYSQMNENIFREKLRKIMVLRWNPEQVLLGQKRTVSGEIIKLSDALSQAAVTKLDTIAWIKDRFQSVEVLYNLNYKKLETSQYGDNFQRQSYQKNITPKSINNPNDIVVREISTDIPSIDYNKFESFYPLGDYSKLLLIDIQYFSRPEFYAPLKVAKRLWNLSRISNCRDLLIQLNPLMESDVAALNQIKSEIEVIQDIIDIKPAVFNNLKILNIEFESVKINDAVTLNNITNKLFTQILNFSKRLSNHLDISIYQDIKPSFTVLFSEWMVYNGTGKFNSEVVKYRLNLISEILSKEIIRESDKYLEDISNLNMQCQNKTF